MKMKKFWQQHTNWELWSFNIIYAPLIFVWGYYAIRAKRFWFFSPVNPSLDFSGFEGETKQEMFEQLDKEVYPNTIYIKPNETFKTILQRMQDAGLQYPVAVKPDIGTKGLCFRKIENDTQLLAYHKALPVDYLIQDMIEMPMELSVFYVRYPNEPKGRVTGMIAKEYLNVTGNGTSTLMELIENNPKAKNRVEELRKKHKDNLDKIIQANEVYYLSITGNHNRGAKFTNLHQQIDEKLVTVFDGISNHTKNFYYGRYDLKTTSIDDLKEGKNIAVLEFNGVGAEPNHIYDCNMSYWQALKTIANHWKYMYQIGKQNHKKGTPYIGFVKGLKHIKQAKAVYKKLEEYDLYC